MDSIGKDFGNNVRAARKKRHITQEELAMLADIDRSYMSRIERGIVSITLDKVYRIAHVLGCDLQELLPPQKAFD